MIMLTPPSLSLSDRFATPFLERVLTSLFDRLLTSFLDRRS